MNFENLAPDHTTAEMEEVGTHIAQGEAEAHTAPTAFAHMSHSGGQTSGPASRNLSDVISVLNADDGLTKQRRARLIGDCRLFAARLGKEAQDVRAHLPTIANLFRRRVAADFGMKPRRFKDFRNNVVQAVNLFEQAHGNGHGLNKAALSPGWLDLLARLRPFEQMTLRPLGRYCAQRGFEPTGMSELLFNGWAAGHAARSVANDPRKMEREARRLWNRLVAARKVDAIALPGPRPKAARKSLPHKSFGHELQTELEVLGRLLEGEPRSTAFGFTGSLSGAGPDQMQPASSETLSLDDLEASLSDDGAVGAFEPLISLEPSTIQRYRNAALTFASTPVLDGSVPVAELTSLDQVLTVPNILRTVERLRGGQSNEDRNRPSGHHYEGPHDCSGRHACDLSDGQTRAARHEQARNLPDAQTRGPGREQARDLPVGQTSDRRSAGPAVGLKDYTGYHDTLINTGMSLINVWCAAPEAQIKTLKQARYRLRKQFPRSVMKGMTHKNRERLARLDHDNLLGRYYQLCAEIAADEERHRRKGKMIGTGRAIRMRNAAMLALVQAVPVRRGNLGSLVLGEHLILPPSGKLSARSSMRLSLDETQVKNDRPFSAIVPLDVARLIQTYLAHYRPVLLTKVKTVCPQKAMETATETQTQTQTQAVTETGGGQPTDLPFVDQNYVFPSERTGLALTDSSTSRVLTSFVDKELGLAFNPQLARHITGKLILGQGGSMALVGAVLGHAEGSSATQRYAEFETDKAVGLLADLTEQKRQGLARKRRSRRARSTASHRSSHNRHTPNAITGDI